MAVFLLIGKTSALTMNIAGVVKDWLLIGLSVWLYKCDGHLVQLQAGVTCAARRRDQKCVAYTEVRHRAAGHQCPRSTLAAICWRSFQCASTMHASFEKCRRRRRQLQLLRPWCQRRSRSSSSKGPAHHDGIVNKGRRTLWPDPVVFVMLTLLEQLVFVTYIRLSHVVLQ